MVHHKIYPSCALNIVYVLDDRVNFIKLYVQVSLFIYEINCHQNKFDPSFRRVCLCHNGLRDMVDILCLDEDYHEKIGLCVIYLQQSLFSPEVNVPPLIMGRSIAEIEVSHIVPGIEYILVEHICKHVLLLPQSIIDYVHQNAIGIDPSLTMVDQPNIFMPVEFITNPRYSSQ